MDETETEKILRVFELCFKDPIFNFFKDYSGKDFPYDILQEYPKLEPLSEIETKVKQGFYTDPQKVLHDVIKIFDIWMKYGKEKEHKQEKEKIFWGMAAHSQEKFKKKWKKVHLTQEQMINKNLSVLFSLEMSPVEDHKPPQAVNYHIPEYSDPGMISD